MGLNCGVPGCRRNSRNDLGHSFFSLPKDAGTRENWLKFVGRNDDHGHIRICTDHFDPKMIAKRFPRPLLVRNAVPTIHKNLNGSTDTKLQSRKLMIVEDTPATFQRDRSLSPPTEVINIHADNISQIIISNEHRRLVVNIIDPRESDDCTRDDIKIDSESSR